MTTSLDIFEPDHRELFVSVLEARDQELLGSLGDTADPTEDQRRRVLDILSDEFTKHVGPPDWEPDERGKVLDDILGTFLLRFPSAS